jgi:hypothetical protein
MADIHGSPASDGSQMPQAMTSGPAPVPYTGPDQAPEPPGYGSGIAALTMGMGAGADVLVGVSGNAVQESGYAHDVNAGLCTPYFAGQVSPIQAHGDADAGGRDDVSGTVAGAVANAEARFMEHESDTLQQGSVIGDLMALPPSPLDPGVGSLGITDPSGAFYDPPRGGPPSTFPNTGNEPG